MTYTDLIDHFVTQKAAGEALKPLDGRGVAQSTVAGWKITGIPDPRQSQYELVTHGKLKADRAYRKQAA